MNDVTRIDAEIDDEPTDAALVAQPIAYWTGVADRALVSFIRGELARLGLTQPQYWVLRYLSENDLSADGGGRTVGELVEEMREFLRPEDDLADESAVLVERGWVREDAGGRLWITVRGEAERLRVKEAVPGMRGRMHEGINDADYVVTVRTLRRMMRNVGARVA
jgi:DNA-binding MarR family transcriptional regulator